jgi:hypothetical protein
LCGGMGVYRDMCGLGSCDAVEIFLSSRAHL